MASSAVITVILIVIFIVSCRKIVVAVFRFRLPKKNCSLLHFLFRNSAALYHSPTLLSKKLLILWVACKGLTGTLILHSKWCLCAKVGCVFTFEETLYSFPYFVKETAWFVLPILLLFEFGRKYIKYGTFGIRILLPIGYDFLFSSFPNCPTEIWVYFATSNLRDRKVSIKCRWRYHQGITYFRHSFFAQLVGIFYSKCLKITVESTARGLDRMSDPFFFDIFCLNLYYI